MRFLLSITLAITLLVQCRVKPEEYLQRAQQALDDENTELALQQYQRAYEESLPENYFVYDRDTPFHLLQISANKNWLALVSIEKEDESKDVYNLFLKDLVKENSYNEKIPFKVDKLQVAPGGQFILFTQKVGEKCQYFVWATEEEKFSEALPLPADCRHSPAISNSGQVLYMKKGEIGSFTVNDGKDQYPYMEKFPDKPLSKLPAWAYFTFSPNNIPYLAYGALGSYKLYNLDNKKLTLLSRAGSYWQIFFMQNKDEPAMITGGAGKRQVVIYQGKSYGKTLHAFSIKNWLEAAFVDKNVYYFLQGQKLLAVKEKKMSELPFWASQIHVDQKQNLYFLSPLGTALIYRGKPLGKKSQAIFEKGWDLYESSL